MHVSFRNRLTFFFILLVILPVLAVAAVGLLIVESVESSSTEDQVQTARKTAGALYESAQDNAGAVAGAFAREESVAAAIRDNDEQDLERQLEKLTNEDTAKRALLDLDGQAPINSGVDDAVAPARSEIQDAGTTIGTIELSTIVADDYSRLVGDAADVEVLVSRGNELLGGTLTLASVAGIETSGEAEIGGTTYAVESLTAKGFGESELTVRVLLDSTEADETISNGQLGLLFILLAFLLCAFAFAITAARSLQAQIDRLLSAARALGKGDFSVEVPAEGNDEFAALGREFNSMARQLESRLEELQLERSRLQETVKRVGESLGKGLDRDALLGIVVQTAVDGVGAEGGRVVLRDMANGAQPEEAARAGNVASYLAAMMAAEAAAMANGEAAETQISGANALARPLPAPEPDEGMLGVISIARPGGAFSERQQELFAYLARQAAISIENVGLHETIQRQAVTDELTGLFNHRRFQEVMTAEVERVRRFEQELGLIMLDIDNFKRVNDTYGHLQGDHVLREVARVLREASREVDEPARYGGEEMAVALPQTGLDGAFEFAERVRTQIEALELPLLDGDGVLHVTASFGVAALPHSAKSDKDALVAAADAALYRAKRSGKNRTVKAE
ncbi:MAG TPA: diguanylate cyclase [Solirubrobacteraceae bacterium]|nr:diguanylate cyclase [Solirubrobacteraceae bacterium]